MSNEVETQLPSVTDDDGWCCRLERWHDAMLEQCLMVKELEEREGEPCERG